MHKYVCKLYVLTIWSSARWSGKCEGREDQKRRPAYAEEVFNILLSALKYIHYIPLL